LGSNINSNNFLEVLIAGVKLTPRVKYVSKYKGNRRGTERCHRMLAPIHSLDLNQNLANLISIIFCQRFYTHAHILEIKLK